MNSWHCSTINYCLWLNSVWSNANLCQWISSLFREKIADFQRQAITKTKSRVLLLVPKASHLTHWGRNKIDAILQTTFWNAFFLMKMFEFRIRFHWSLFLRVQSTVIQYWFRQWLGAVQATSHYLNQCWLDYRPINASLGLNELRELNLITDVLFQGNILKSHTAMFAMPSETGL